MGHQEPSQLTQRYLMLRYLGSGLKSLPEKKPYQVAIKKEADEDVPRDDMNDQICDEETTEAVKHEGQDTSKDVREFVASLSFQELQVMMSISGHNGTVYLQNTNRLQRRIQRRLSGGLKRTVSARGGLSGFSQRIAEDAALASKYLDKPLCVGSLMAGCDAPAESLRPDKDPMFACERCVQAKKVCLYLITHEEKPVLCMVRQPEETCTGAN
ncbi:hypothetical protein BKA63DRAFT_267293 [Paraphoma chrysanthemicola]|nr:hypothetical protein BKA63DRAFT_267293 [Paraphoma chrysanthemicola]